MILGVLYLHVQLLLLLAVPMATAMQEDDPDWSGWVELGSNLRTDLSYGYLALQYVVLLALAGNDNGSAVAHDIAAVGAWPFDELAADVAVLAFGPPAPPRLA